MPHASKYPEQVPSYDGEPPAWFRRGVEAALLTPTAFGKQAFMLTGRGEEVALTCEESDGAGQDRGILRYFFEVGAGPDAFTWTD